MRDLNWALKQLCLQHQDGSFATRRDRERSLSLVANQLHEIGFRRLSVSGFKPKHIEALIQRWQNEALSNGTIKNRLSHLRWLTGKIDKQNIMARTNDTYGIAQRSFVSQVSKGHELSLIQLRKVSNPYSNMSLRLQAAFGLRREESLKIQPGWADRGTALVLKASWCKGGRPREIPMSSDEQCTLINIAKAITKGGSLIPCDHSYKEQLNIFRRDCEQAGIHKVHGLRHQYAQNRYLEKTGWPCPVQGGPTVHQLSVEQKQVDMAARLLISEELGHGREQITTVYLGR